MAAAGRSLAELHPEIATEFVFCLRPKRSPANLRPSSNIACVWRCPVCELEYEANPAARIRGRSCPACAPAKGGDVRSRREALGGNSLAEQFPVLAAEFVGLDGRTGRLHRSLVLEQEIAFSAFARQTPLERGGQLSLTAEAKSSTRP